MAQNIILTIHPRRGDAVLGDLSTGMQVVAMHESMMAAELDTARYEYIGPVVHVDGKKVYFAYKLNAAQPWSARYSFKLTGYTLDGTDRNGTIQLWTSGTVVRDTSYVVSYNASTADELVLQLNTAFQNATDYPYFKSQDWYALKESDGSVTVHFNFTDYRQASNTGTAGFALTANLLPSVKALANIRRKNGAVGGDGVISSLPRALVYFRSDNSSTTYNPASDVTSTRRAYPICLPGYLGTSQHQSDHCAYLRSVFGEGETGWLKFMESCRPVLPSDWGNMGMRDGKARTQELAAQTFVSNTVLTPAPLCPAASYCANIATATLPKGSFWLPTTEEIAHLLDGIYYNTVNNRNADKVNALQLRMGGSAISNGTHWWSCLRYSAYYAWFARGGIGFFGNYSMYSGIQAVPLSLLTLA